VCNHKPSINLVLNTVETDCETDYTWTALFCYKKKIHVINVRYGIVQKSVKLLNLNLKEEYGNIV
jgi:hypothetical protein